MRIDPESNELAERVPLGENARSIGFGAGSVWATHVFGTPPSTKLKVTRHDLETGTELARIELSFEPGVVIVDDDGVWINGNAFIDGQIGPWVVGRIVPASNRLVSVTEIHDSAGVHFGLAFSDVAVGGGFRWVPTNAGLVQLDHRTNQVIARYDGLTGGGVATTDTAVWVTDYATRKLYRIPFR